MCKCVCYYNSVVKITTRYILLRKWETKMKKFINAEQVVERNENLHTIDLYEKYTDKNKKNI